MKKIQRIGDLFRARNLKVRMLAAFIPVVILTLITTGYLTYRVSNYFILVALEKAARIHVASLAHEMEQFLEKCRKDLAIVAQTEPSQASLGRYLANLRKIGEIDYRILAFIPQGKDDPIVQAALDESVQAIEEGVQGKVEPNLLALYENVKSLKEEETWISKVIKLEYPFSSSENRHRTVSTSAILFGTRTFTPEGTPAGYFLLAVSIQNFKKTLTAYHLEQSRFWSSEEGAEERYSYFFDPLGWILFDSGNPKGEKTSDLNTELARFGYKGILGKPEFAAAYKPDSAFENFWNMVDHVKTGKHGSTKTANLEIQSPGYSEHFCAYAPVLFRGGTGGLPEVYGGVAFVDRGRVTEAAISRQVDVVFIITLLAIVIVSLVIFFLAHFITKPLLALTHAVDSMHQNGKLEPIEIPRPGHEIALLKNSINMMISKIVEQIEQIKYSERQVEIATLRGTADIGQHDDLKYPFSEIGGLIGASPGIENLRSDILKAAKVDMDVLIVGETGTGKQLAAEAIHRHSRRSSRPMVSINCGELDEHLLLDTLFGHLKGAFTEAKSDRKGAFVESEGGVIFLDEIQTASSAVQQALLRVISQRKIKHLGSDRDTDVDVRVIAATNADLKSLVDHGKFRPDLYFRLKVITIHTPSLREIKEDVPLLVRHYFAEAKTLTQKKGLTISKGALEKLKAYDWPGNVRELRNCITRAVVMSESTMIQAEDLVLEPDSTLAISEGTESIPRVKEDPTKEETDYGLNLPANPGQVMHLTHRQKKVYSHLLEKGSITRLEYQALVGDNLAPRTAVYDLHDMVRKGLIRKEGKGPATRYTLCRTLASYASPRTDAR